MTQSIKKCNETTVGKTYPVCDLRTAKSIEQLCEYVDAGHPIAKSNGIEVRLFRRSIECFCFDFWFDIKKIWIHDYICINILEHIKLAPLAYRNGRPLHVGDEIAVNAFNGSGELVPKTRIVTTDSVRFTNWGLAQWRFADEVTA